jgi:hypothetical protein
MLPHHFVESPRPRQSAELKTLLAPIASSNPMSRHVSGMPIGLHLNKFTQKSSSNIRTLLRPTNFLKLPKQHVLQLAPTPSVSAVRQAEYHSHIVLLPLPTKGYLCLAGNWQIRKVTTL